MNDLIDVAYFQPVRRRLAERLQSELYGSDVDWIRDGQFVGLPNKPDDEAPDRTLSLQRGRHWPVPPQN